MSIKDFLKKSFSKDPEFQAAAKERKIQRILDEREKGSNERELERFREEQRQVLIKKRLDTIRKMKTRQAFKSGIMDTTNIFKNHKSILTEDHKILNEGNMFFK